MAKFIPKVSTNPNEKIFLHEILDLKNPIWKKGEKPVKVTPKKDWTLLDGKNTWELKREIDISIPEKFLTSLETEGVL